MIKLLLKGIALFLCFAVLVVAINVKVDKYGFFNDNQVERSVVKALLNGKTVVYNELSINERELMRIYVEDMPSALDVAVLCSSRGMQITKGFAPKEDTFFNFGISGADIRDIMNIYYYMYQNNKIPKKIVLVVDPWFFSATEEAFSATSNADDYNEFLSQVLGFPQEFKKTSYKTIIEKLVSPSVFQENIQHYFKNKNVDMGLKFANPNTYTGTSALRLADGTQLYPLEFREREQGLVNDDSWSLVVDNFFRVEGMKQIDTMLKQRFEAFVHQMKNDGVEVTFILPPYHPNSYQMALDAAKRFPGFFEIEPYILDFAKKNNIAVYGSYDPAALGCDEYDFYDGLHIRRECVKEIYPGIEKSSEYNNLEIKNQLIYPRESTSSQEKISTARAPQ